MKKLDPRSVIIGFLVTVIGFMLMGATSTEAHFKTLTVNDIIIPEEGYIRILGVEGNMIMAISQTQVNDGTLILFNREGQKTVKLSNTLHGDGIFDLFNSTGQKTISLTHTTDGTGDAIFSLFNKYQEGAVYLGTTEAGEGTIVVSDEHGVGRSGLIGKKI